LGDGKENQSELCPPIGLRQDVLYLLVEKLAKEGMVAMSKILFTLGLLASASLSATETWITPGSGDYDDVSNWTSQVPDAATDVVFNQNTAYSVTLPGTGSWVAGTVTVEQGDLSFDLGGNGFEVGPPSIAGPTLFVGTAVGNPATLTLTHGDWTMQANAGFDFGTVAGSSGTLNVTGSDATFTGGGGFASIGVSGDGNLNISNGGTFTFGNSTEIAENAGSSGSVIVDGPGSSLEGRTLEVANNGNGYLSIQNGANVSLSSSGFRMGDHNGGVGIADVSGAGSTLTTSGMLIANFGTATLNISDHAVVTASGTSTLAWNSGTGTINVASAGLLKTTGSLTLTRGGSGTAFLNINEGGLVKTFSNRIFPLGIVRSGNLTVNEGGTLHLNGGSLNAYKIYVNGETGFGGPGNFIFDDGFLTTDWFYGDLVQNGGIMTLHEDPSVTNISGNFHQAGPGKLKIDISGNSYSLYDNLTVSGTATLAGILSVKLKNGFLPAPGDGFDVLKAEVISADFANFQFPTLPDGLGWRSHILVDEVGPTDVLRLTAENIVIDFDPWSDLNEIRPKDEYNFGLMIKTTSIAAGDAYDFDASTVDVDSLRAGPDGAQNVAVVILPADYDEDGDTDYIFSFKVQYTGLTCQDQMIIVTGTDLSGNPIGGSDRIVPVNCEEIATIDVDPWNMANEIRPNDSYTVPVSIMSTSVANGEPADIDATQIDPTSLKFGPNQVPHTGAIITTDLDSDSDIDVVFGFDAFSSGIACGDTELTVEGRLYDTQEIVGMDSITTTDCDSGGCHP
jgi:T5SS/PEP-CTERM-associated repeat protein